MTTEENNPAAETEQGAAPEAGGGENISEPDAAESAAAAEVAEAEDPRRKADEYYAALQRLKAEFDNFRKRTRKEKEDIAKYGAEQLVLKLLPVMDNLGRALEASAQTRDFDSLCQGVDMICRQLGKVLEDEGVVPIEAVGRPFDPNLHEALLREESDQEENTVLAELEKGYYLKGKVVRPSRVKVSS
ncbi:MAG: nucleotide exchange factor GrpE [Gracilibacteraceae bacterium]|nr:nucleotide exchange factor GrpE [Gracilibacteraceae bacterium]